MSYVRPAIADRQLQDNNERMNNASCIYDSKSQFIEERQKVIDWAVDSFLSVLPVAPKQDAEQYPVRVKGEIQRNEDGTPRPLFCGKNPSYLDANGKPQIVKHGEFQEVVPKAEQIKKWFADESVGIGILCGQQDIYCIDIDRKNFDTQEECDRAFESIKNQLPGETLTEQTPSGGYHIFVLLRSNPSFTNFAQNEGGKHVGELLGAGRFVVLAPTPGYINLSWGDLVEVESVESLGIYSTKARRKKAPAPSKKPDAVPTYGEDVILLENLLTDKASQVLSGSDISGDRSESLTVLIREAYGWLNWGAANGVTVSGDADHLAAIAGGALGIDADRIERILATVEPSECMPSAYHRGDDDACWKKVHRLQGKKQPAATPKRHKQASAGELHEITDDEAPQDLCPIAKSYQQLKHLLDSNGVTLRLNTLTKEMELDGETVTVERLELELALKFNRQFKHLQTVARAIAEENQYSPVKEYLERVSAQYGSDTSILEGFAHRYFGQSAPIYNTFIKRFFVGAVARIFEPGCKLDTALILQGGQGLRKSSFFREVATQDWFDDSLGNVGDKDERLKLQRAWFIEWAELETVFKRKDISATKAFLSCSVDAVRPPYGRSVEQMKRQSVIVGSTNEDEFLGDSTGNRRFWVLPVRKVIDTEQLRKERDRIWAAAVALYQSGYAWWLSGDEERTAAAIAQEYAMRDPWHEAIERYIDHRSMVTTSELVSECLKLEIARQDRGSAMRVASILKQLGWESPTGGRVYQGKRRRVWVPKAEARPTQSDFEDVSEVVQPESFDNSEFEADRHNQHTINQQKTQISEEDVSKQEVGNSLPEPKLKNREFEQNKRVGCVDDINPNQEANYKPTHLQTQGCTTKNSCVDGFQLGDVVKSPKGEGRVAEIDVADDFLKIEGDCFSVWFRSHQLTKLVEVTV